MSDRDWRTSRDQDRERYDLEFENRGVPTSGWSNRRVGTDTGYRNTDYGGSWGQQTTGGMRGQYSGGLVQRSGRHVGKGPKNWRRSDDSIREDVNEALTQHPEVDASEIEVQVSNSEVMLTGFVSTRHEKRVAEDCAWNAHGVHDVHNHLKIPVGK
jgi:osmotically-inducible protein OsmY